MSKIREIRIIVDRIGRERLALRLGLKNAKSVWPAISRGFFPPAWYPIVEELAEEEGIEVPSYLYNWRKADSNHTAA